MQLTSTKETKEEVSASQVTTRAEKLTIRGVITHEKLMTWIKERNPIIAQARKDERSR